jgi:hypothetical protein
MFIPTVIAAIAPLLANVSTAPWAAVVADVLTVLL